MNTTFPAELDAVKAQRHPIKEQNKLAILQERTGMPRSKRVMHVSGSAGKAGACAGGKAQAAMQAALSSLQDPLPLEQ